MDSGELPLCIAAELNLSASVCIAHVSSTSPTKEGRLYDPISGCTVHTTQRLKSSTLLLGYRRVLITLLATGVFPQRVIVSIKTFITPFGNDLPSQNIQKTNMEPDRTIVTTVWVSLNKGTRWGPALSRGCPGCSRS